MGCWCIGDTPGVTTLALPPCPAGLRGAALMARAARCGTAGGVADQEPSRAAVLAQNLGNKI